MNEPYYLGDAFTCPHCQVYAHQNWGSLYSFEAEELSRLANYMYSTCIRCKANCIWVNEQLAVPDISTAPMPSEDMPDDVKEDFLEARTVVDRSPRSAAALLRLAIQKLMPHLGEKGHDLNTDIGNLVRKGLSVQVQQALDSVRVIGNESVHPGTIDMKDNRETALALFGLMNFIVQQMITNPRQISALYNSLPQGKLKAIAQRDGKKTA